MDEPIFPKIDRVDQKYGRVSLRTIMGDPSAAWRAAAGALFALGKPVSCLDCSAEATMVYRQESGDKHAGAGNLRLQCPACGEISPITLRKASPPSAPDVGIPASTHKTNADQTVAVATDVYFNPDMSTCPRGLKVQLVGEGGVAAYGTYNGDPFWIEWAPVPKRRKSP